MMTTHAGTPHRTPLSAENIWRLPDLERHFGAQPSTAPDLPWIVGDRHLALLEEMTEIVDYQWSSDVRRGLVRGFFLSGPPGTGKTTLGQALGLRLCQRLASRGESGVLATIDGSEIARSRYGDSEARIREIFARAASGFTSPGEHTILLFDDVESILMARGSAHAKEWHFSQDSVFFHAVDALDTRRVTVVLTSNRADLVDAAIRDRFLEYFVDYPDPRMLLDVAARLAGPSEPDLEGLLRSVGEQTRSGALRSLRDVERFLLQHRVAGVLGRPSFAENRVTRPGDPPAQLRP